MLLPLFLLFSISCNCLVGQDPKNLLTAPAIDFCLCNAKKANIKYYLFKSFNQKYGIEATDNYEFPKPDKKMLLKLFIHGYNASMRTDWYQKTRAEYFLNNTLNIVYVDWSSASNYSYLTAAANVKPVANFVSDFLINTRVPLDNIHIIGHCLGAHVAGYVGKYIFFKTGEKIARITGMNPAGPCFTSVSREYRLCHLDAQFVDIIHTEIDYYGFMKPIGHVDFYINGGRKQPKCLDSVWCSHEISTAYFSESINKRDVLSSIARLTEQDTIEILGKDAGIEFGEFTPLNTKGTYHLKTRQREPYLIEIKKVHN